MILFVLRVTIEVDLEQTFSRHAIKNSPSVILVYMMDA